MPYYRWRGIDLFGVVKKGTLFARSPEHLDQLLLKRELALLTCNPIKQWFKKRIKINDKVQFFTQFATLISAGVLIPDALEIVANQVDNPTLAEIMNQVSFEVLQGRSMSQALQGYRELADPITLQLIKAGEESGKIAPMLDALCTHLLAIQDFQQRIRSALLLPAITLMFFIVVIGIIFLVIMPRFIDVFASMKKDIPPLTRSLLFVSEAIKTPSMGLIASLFAFFCLIIWRVIRRGKGRRILDAAFLKLPIIGQILQDRFLAYSMQALGVLLEGGLPLADSLSIVSDSIENHHFRQQFAIIAGHIEAGVLLSESMARHPDPIFGQNIIAMVEVAEASGNLSLLLGRVAQVYYRRVSQRLNLITMLLQPAIMIILGLLVALLIFAVYGPIFSFSGAF